MPPSIMYAAYSSILHSKEKTGRILGTWHQYLMNFRASALLRNIQNIRICVGEKTYCFCNQRKWKDFNKKQFTLLKMCVTSLLCGPRADLWTFCGFLCKRLSLYINVYPGGGGYSHTLLVPVDINRKTTGARDCLPPRVWVIWVSDRVAIFQR